VAFEPGTHLGSYQILSLLGRGGMGEVYRARDVRLQRDVALKVLSQDARLDAAGRARLEREAQALAALNHPNIAAIHGLEESGGHLALVMECVEGEPLSARIGPTGLPVRDTLKLAAQIAAGLDAAHRAGVVHRDLKPANVLVTPTGGVKIVDFGIAKLGDIPATVRGNEAGTTLAALTAVHRIVGTVAYMSPEQARGEPVDGRSDVFSFGILLYEMLTGRRPFAGDGVNVLAAILERDPPPLSTRSGTPLPRDLERMVLRCLRKDKERRVQSAADLNLELEDLASDYGRLPAAAATERPVRMRPAITAAAALAAAAATWFGAALFRSPAPAAPTFRQLTFEPGAAVTPALSPDGKLLAYASDRSGEGQLDIWLKQLAGGEPVRLTSGPDSKANPQFVPDGTRVVYLGARSSLFEVPALGGPSHRLLDEAGPFTISSQGDVVFHRLGTGTTPGPMFVLKAGAASPTAWHPECVSAGAPAWSSDGSRIAFIGDCTPNSEPTLRRGYVLVSPLNGGAVRQVGTVQIASSVPRIAWIGANGAEGLLIPITRGDTTNLHRLSLDGTLTVMTAGTGVEAWPVVSRSGDLIFTRTDQTPAVWRRTLTGGEPPSIVASPARLFAVDPEEQRLVFGRMQGSEYGQLVLRDPDGGAETVLASHRVKLEGGGSFWPQVSPDGRRVVYRVQEELGSPNMYVVPTDGGTPRGLVAAGKPMFWTPSAWSPDGNDVIGECRPVGALCTLDPQSGQVREFLTATTRSELLYPSLSWDNRWITFMRRRAGETAIVAAPRDGDRYGPETAWARISPRDADGSRPRFAPDGNSVFYILTRGSIATVVRQNLDPATKQPIGEPLPIARVQHIPTTALFTGLQNLIAVSRRHVYFNAADVHANVWMMHRE
jgi:Tol biopolymer transport system component